MSSAVESALSAQTLLLVDTSVAKDDYSTQLEHAGVSAQFVSISNPGSVENELRKQAYDLVLWRISREENELGALEALLRRPAAPLPPLIVIAPKETRGSRTEDRLLELVGRGIRDYCFEDEPAVLRRTIHRIRAEQTEYDQHQENAEFVRSPEALIALMEACPLAVVAVTSEGRVLLWNGSAEKIYGWRREEVMGKLLPTIPAGGQDEFRQLLESQLHGVSLVGREVERHRKDGTLIDVSLWTAPLRDKRGRIRAKLAISADITERRRAREHLILVENERDARTRFEAMARFEELLEAAPDAIIEVDADGKIVLLNVVTEQMFGYSRQELLGQTVDVLVPDELRQRHTDTGHGMRAMLSLVRWAVISICTDGARTVPGFLLRSV